MMSADCRDRACGSRNDDAEAKQIADRARPPLTLEHCGAAKDRQFFNQALIPLGSHYCGFCKQIHEWVREFKENGMSNVYGFDPGFPVFSLRTEFGSD